MKALPILMAIALAPAAAVAADDVVVIQNPVWIRKPDGIALKRGKSETLFLFRPYEDGERMQPAEISHVRFLLRRPVGIGVLTQVGHFHAVFATFVVRMRQCRRIVEKKRPVLVLL